MTQAVYKKRPRQKGYFRELTLFIHSLTFLTTAERRAMSSNSITFCDVKDAYLPNADIKLSFRIEKDYQRARRDWVGIFKVGFSSSRDYYTFVWVPEVAVPEGDDEVEPTVTYPARSIPTEDGQFYQFVYVSATTGNVVTVSKHFMMGKPLDHEPEFIEIPSSEGMESMLMISTGPAPGMEDSSPPYSSSPSEIEGLRSNVAALETKLKTNTAQWEEAMVALESLKAQLSTSEEGKVSLLCREEAAQGRARELEGELKGQQDELLDRDVQIEALRRDYQASTAQMEQKLGAAEQELVRAMLAAEGLGAEVEAERRRAQEQGECSSELAAVRIQLEQTRKEGVDVVDVLMTEKRSLQSEVQSCQERIDRLTAEGMARAEDTAALQRRLKESEEMLQELMKCHDEGQRAVQELQEQRKAMASVQARNSEQQETLARFGEDLISKDSSLARVNEELAMSQANVAELVGACPRDRPQVRAERNGVDPQAHEALRRTADKLTEDKREVSSECSRLRQEVEGLRGREKELVMKLEQCREEYTQKATEVQQLSQQLRKTRSSSTSNTQETQALRDQLLIANSEVARVRAQLTHLKETEEVAIQELTQRQEEIDQLQRSGAEKDGRIAQLERDMLVKDNEIMLIEERTDKKVHDKNGELQILRDSVQDLMREVDEVRTAADGERRSIADLQEALRLGELSLIAARDECDQVKVRADQDRKTIVNLQEALRLNEDSLRARSGPPAQPRPQPHPQRFTTTATAPPYMPPSTQPRVSQPQPHYPQLPQQQRQQPYAPPFGQQPRPQPQPRPQAPAPPRAQIPAEHGKCPVCQHIFPQSELEAHTNGHFNN